MGLGPEPTIANDAGRPVVSPTSVSQAPFQKLVAVNPKDFEAWGKIYTPDDGDDVRAKTISVEEHYKRAAIPRTVAKKETTVMGRFAVHGERGHRSVFASGWKELDQLRASASWKAMRMREAYGLPRAQATKMLREAVRKERTKEQFDWFGLNTQSDLTGNSPNDEFHPLLLGPFQRQLYLYDMLDSQSKAYEAWNHNPIAKAIINLMVHFTLGDGVKIKWKNDQLGDKWGEWTRANRWEEKTRLWVRDACILGDTFLHDAGSLNGAPTFDLLDASTVWEIMTNPRRIDDVYYLHRQFPTQYQVPYGTLDATANNSLTNMIPSMEYVVEQIPPTEWLQVKLNSTIGEKRGRSDLFPILGWLKRFRDWFNAAVVRGQISNAFVLWWELDGSADDIQAFKNNQDFKAMPAPGSVFYSNKAAVPHLMGIDGGITASDQTGEQLLSVIATSMNLPPEYLGVVGKAPRASAMKRGEPAAKIFETRQALAREVISWQLRRFAASMLASEEIDERESKPAAISHLVHAARRGDHKSAHMLIDAMKNNQDLMQDTDLAFDIIMPSLEPEDRTIRLKDLTTARMAGVLSQETYSNLSADLLDIKDYDFDDEQERMAQEAERGIVVPSVAKTEPDPAAAPGAPGDGGAETPPPAGSSVEKNRAKDKMIGKPRRV